jgi:hypothetical protein
MSLIFPSQVVDITTANSPTVLVLDGVSDAVPDGVPDECQMEYWMEKTPCDFAL